MWKRNLKSSIKSITVAIAFFSAFMVMEIMTDILLENYSYPNTNFVYFIIKMSFNLMLIYFSYRFYRKNRVKSIKRKINLYDILLIFFTYIFLLVIGYYFHIVWSSAIYGTVSVPFKKFIFSTPGPFFTDKWLNMEKYFELVVFAPIFEEILFRGILNNAFEGRIKSVIRALIVSIIFTIMHIYNIRNVIQFLGYLSLAIGLQLIFERRYSLFDSILLHSLSNGLLIIGIMTIQNI